MQVIKKTNSGIQNLSLDAVLLDRRKVFLSGGIDSESVDLVVKQLLFLESMDEREPIQLIINSPGGEVLAGLYLYDQLKGMKVPIDIYCAEMAASMAAILLAAGRKGHRYILKHSKVMIHEPLISSSSGGISGSASSIAKSAESIMQTKRDLVTILAQDTGRSEKEIEKAVSYDNFMTAEEAVKFGICDKIVERI